MRNDLNSLLAELEMTEVQISNLKTHKEQTEETIKKLIETDIQEQVGLNDYGCGTATIETEDYKLKAVVSKKVKWDQEKLAELAERIKASGEEVGVYMKAEYKVSETSFKQWPTMIQDAFFDARTVEASKPSLKIERKEV